MNTHRFFIFSTFLLLISTLSVCAQSFRLHGFVALGPKDPGEFALVALYSRTDSVHKTVTYTDKAGYYSFAVKPDVYNVEVRYVGCEPSHKSVTVDSLHPVVRLDFVLKPSGQLDEVVVLGKRSEGVDKKSYEFDAVTKKAAHNLLDVVLTLPQIKADARTGNIISASGDAAPIILINGRYGTNEELRSIPPGKIIRVDYYDIAPERYNTRGSVMDVITKPLDEGHHAGIGLSVAPIATDARADLFYSYNQGNHQVKIFSKGFLRHTRKGREENSDLQYNAGHLYAFQTQSVSQIRYKDGTFAGVYSFKQPEKRYFELSVTTSYEKDNNPNEYDISYSDGSQTTTRKGWKKESTSIFTPVIDLYYERRLHGGNRFFANMVYTYNNTHNDLQYEEKDGDLLHVLLEDQLANRTRKHSIIGQLEYAHPFKSSWLYVGTQLMYSKADFSLQSLISGNVDDTQKQFRNRIYLTWEGSLNKFFYRISPRFYLHYASAHLGLDKSQTRIYFSPKVLVGWRLPKGQRLRMELETENLIPDLGRTTQAISLTREGLYRKSNPQLENSYLATASIYHDWSNKYLDISNKLIYSYANKSWILSFREDTVKGLPAIVVQDANSKYSETLNLHSSVSVKPFGDNSLQLRFFVKPRYQHYKLSNDRHISLFSIPSGGSVSYEHGNWGIQGDVDFPYKDLRDFFSSTSNWYSALTAFWNKGPWSIRLSLENLFIAEKSTNKNHSFILLKENGNSTMKDNFWKVGFSVNYYFSIGKEYKGSRNLNNEDSDKGSL